MTKYDVSITDNLLLVLLSRVFSLFSAITTQCSPPRKQFLSFLEQILAFLKTFHRFVNKIAKIYSFLIYQHAKFKSVSSKIGGVMSVLL